MSYIASLSLCLPHICPCFYAPFAYEQKEAKFKQSKQAELLALQKRIQTGREEQKKQRHMDLERLLQRYQNVKSELEAQQNLERIRAEKMSQAGILATASPAMLAGGSKTSAAARSATVSFF